MTDPYLAAYSVAMAALGGDRDAVRTVFATVTPEETAHVAEGSVLAMADIVRVSVTPEVLADMIENILSVALGEVGQ